MNMTARRAFFVLGVILCWIGLVGLCYQVAIVRDYSQAGFVGMAPDLVLIIAGLILHGQILEPLYAAAIAFGSYMFLWSHESRVWTGIMATSGFLLLVEHGINRFQKWQIRKRLNRQASEQRADPDRDGLIPEYPGAYDHLLHSGRQTVIRRRLHDLDSDQYTTEG